MEDEKMIPEMEGEVQGNQMSALSRIFGVFYEPSKVFASLNKKNDWLLPFLIMVIIGFAVYYVTLPITSRDMKESITKNMEKYRDYMTAEQFDETMKKIEEGFADPFKWYSPLIIIAMTFVTLIIISAISLVSGNFLFGGKSNFWIIMGVVAFAGLIGLLGDVARSLLILAKGEMAVYTGLGLLKPVDDASFLFYLFRQIDAFTIWRIVATAIGLGVIYNMKPRKFAYVLFPIWLIFIALVAAANLFTGGSILY